MKKEILRINYLCIPESNSTQKNMIHLNLYEGELLCVTGARKSGKSLLVNLIRGTIPLNPRNYLVCESPVNMNKLRSGHLEEIRFVNQESSLIPELTVYENLFLLNCGGKSRPSFINRKKMERQATEILSFANELLQINSSQFVYQLTVCQRKCLEILRHIINNAIIIVLDNSCTLLTKREFEIMSAFINELRSRNFSFIYICNEPDLLLEQSDRIIVLRNGSNAGVIYHEDYNKQKLLRIFSGTAVHQPECNLCTTCTTHVNKVLLQLTDISSTDNSEIDISIHSGDSIGFLTFDTDIAKQLQDIFYHANRFANDSHHKYTAYNHTWSILKNEAQAILTIPQDLDSSMLCEDLTMLQNLRLLLNRHFHKRNRVSNRCLELIGEELDYLSGHEPGWSKKTLAGSLDKSAQKTFMILRCLFFPVDILLLLYPGQELKLTYTQLLKSQNTAIIMVTDSIPELLQSCDYIYILSNRKITKKIACKDVTEEEIFSLWY